MTKIAKHDKLVRDEATGIDRRVLAGQAVPPDLIEAYEADGGKLDDAPRRATGETIAEATLTIRDEALGISRRVIEGLPVPPDLLEAYKAEVGKGKAKAQRAPATDKAERSPATTK